MGSKTTATPDRRERWTPAPRPEWLATLNALAGRLDPAAMVPLDPAGLVAQAMAATGLSDFGDGRWRVHLDILMDSVEREARLHAGGRLLTRLEIVSYLETRLHMVEACRQHPEIRAEAIDRPLFITGYGRSGTTILFELLSKDPQFRVAEKWEARQPCPPPETAHYPDPGRVARAEAHTDLIEAMTPEFQAAHKLGARLPVESLELEYPAFISDVYPIVFNIPAYARHLAATGIREALEWKRLTFQLLQWRCPGRHWLLKSPSHLPHLRAMLDVFPGMRVIFTHRDPVVTADSIVSVMGALYWLRTDHPWGEGGSIDSLSLAGADARARVWDDPIALIRSGALPEGRHAHFHYARFMADPLAEVQRLYADLGMELQPQVAARMRAFLEARPKDRFGRHVYEQTPAGLIDAERSAYATYEQTFGIAREI